MKKIFILFALLILISCGDTTTGITTISILEDTTEDHFQLRPNADDIINVFNLKEDKWQSGRFRYKRITDVSQNPQSKVSLKSAQAFLDNELERDVEVALFAESIKQLVQDSIVKGKNYSSIFKPLMQEIQILQQDSSSISTIYLFSDLQENDPYFFSVYDAEHKRMLVQEPERVQQIFLDSVEGIQPSAEMLQVVVIYQPQTIEEDQQFSQMKSLYRGIFKELGIPIQFTAQLNTI